jgi:hypothetical protein
MSSEELVNVRRIMPTGDLRHPRPMGPLGGKDRGVAIFPSVQLPPNRLSG